ncbi:MAG: tetratricopeptide repeat protein [Tannerella sp.]|jgi:tetratricopeptide (TPR) repeat protein|nr:tetratricopeptide repeat protein [Tannerella sp.]
MEAQDIGDDAEALRRKFDYFFYEGIKLKNADKADAAFDMFRHCLEIDSTSSAALFELSEYYLELDRIDTTIEIIRKCIEYSPQNAEYHNILARLLLDAEMYGEAAEEYEALVKAHPDKIELKMLLAEAYTRSGANDKAIVILDDIENIIGMHETLSKEKFLLYMAIDEKEKAVDEWKKLADKFPEPRYKVIIGDLYLNQNDYDKALSFYRQAFNIDPETPYYPVAMANYFEKTGHADSAKMQIRNALINAKLDTDTKLSILARYVIRLQQSERDIESADTLFHTLLDSHPEESRLKIAYGDFLAEQGKYDEAWFQFQLVTETEPENRIAHKQLLRLSLISREPDKLMTVCIKAKELFPDDYEYPFYLGIAYSQKNDYDTALEIYLNAIPQIPPENKILISEFYGQVGDLFFRKKETDKAFESYETALTMNDKNISVLNNYAYYLSLLKRDLTKAERMSAVCIKTEPDNATYIDTYAWIFFVQGNYSLSKIYIEMAISKDHNGSAELLDHYGDILFLSGDKDKAVEQWQKAKTAGKKSATLDRKINDKSYYEETEDELFDEQ